MAGYKAICHSEADRQTEGGVHAGEVDIASGKGWGRREQGAGGVYPKCLEYLEEVYAG